VTDEDLAAVVELLIDFCNAVEEAAFKLRVELLKYFGPVTSGLTWDPNAIKWVEAEGFKGPYERYPAQGEKAEGSADYWNMLKDLKAHGGRLTRDGMFYWLFQDGSTVGRKKR